MTRDPVRPAEPPLVALRGLEKDYRSRFRTEPALRGIDLDVAPGEFVSIVGPSGSGKSTLLHVLGLLDEPTAGTYRFAGRDVAALARKERTALARGQIAFVFQSYGLLDDLTVEENVAEPLRYQGVPRDERRARVAEALARFGLDGKADRTPGELSGGQQQLVGVVRALAARPRLLLADEPTGNLHSSQGEAVMEALGRLHADDGVTVLHVTHSERWAALGTRAVEMLDGRVVADRRL